MTAKIHAGWGQSMGRKICGVEGDVEQTLDASKVTCGGCLLQIYEDAYRRWRDLHRQAMRAEAEMTRVYLQWKDLQLAEKTHLTPPG